MSYLEKILETLRSDMIEAAQKVYDEWEPDERGEDPELGYGGICEKIGDALADVVVGNIGEDELDYDIEIWGPEGDEHAFLIVYTKKEAWGVDIPAGLYEIHHGMYNWEKIPDVEFAPEDIIIFKMPVVWEPESDDLENP